MAIKDDMQDVQETVINELITENGITNTLADGQVTPQKLSQAYLPLTGGSVSGSVTATGDVESKGGNELRVYRTDNNAYGSIKYLTGNGGLELKDVNGDGMRFKGASSTYITIANSGNVGIGTSSPTSPLGANFKVLDINSGVWGGTINFSGNSAGYIGNRHSGNTGLGYYAVSGQGHHFAVNGANTASVTITSQGHVILSNVPTSSVGLATGTIYRSGTDLKIKT